MFDHDKGKDNVYFALSQGDLGRVYLKSVVEKGQEKDIISALHNIIDAILWDISQQERKE